MIGGVRWKQGLLAAECGVQDPSFGCGHILSSRQCNFCPCHTRYKICVQQWMKEFASGLEQDQGHGMNGNMGWKCAVVPGWLVPPCIERKCCSQKMSSWLCTQHQIPLTYGDPRDPAASHLHTRNVEPSPKPFLAISSDFWCIVSYEYENIRNSSNFLFFLLSHLLYSRAIVDLFLFKLYFL